MTAPQRNLAALIALALLPLVWLWPSVLGGNTFVPFDPAAFPPAALTLPAEDLAAARQDANYDVTEVWPWLLPEMDLIQQEVANGRWPSWNPNARTGAPLHEVGVHGLFYPPHWLWLFGGDAKAKLVWLTWISLALAGLFTFHLLRRVGLSPLAAWSGGAIFQLSGTMATNGYFWTRLPALAWLPALLLAVLHLGAGERTRRGPLVAVAACVALPWYAGFPPYATAGTLLGCLLMLRLVLERLGRHGSLAARQLIARFLFALGLGVLLSMPQLLPSAWFFATEAARSATPSMTMIGGARFELYGLLGYLVPDAFGHPHHVGELPYNLNPLCYLWGNRYQESGAALPPNYNFTEYTVFLSSIGIVLAGFGAVCGRRPLRWFVVLTLLLLLGLALFVPVVNWLYWLPTMSNVAPMRWLSPATLLLCWLAAAGLDQLPLSSRGTLLRLSLTTLGLAGLVAWATSRPAAWHAADPEWPASPIAQRFDITLAEAQQYFHSAAGDRFARATELFATAGWQAAGWLLLCSLVLAAYAMRQRTRSGPWLLGLLPAMAIAQLALFGAPLLRGHALNHGTDTEVHAFLRAEAEASAEQGGFTIARGGGDPQIPLQLPPGQLMVPGIRDLHFYTHYDSRSIEPLRAALGEEWSRNAAGRGYLQRVLPDEALGHPLFDLLGVRYVLSTKPLQNAGARVGPRLRSDRGEFFVYERSGAMPRAFTVASVRALADDDAVLAAMAAPAVQFADTAFVIAADGQSWPTGAGTARTVRFVRNDPSVVELDISAGKQPYLVLTDTWLPGWSATVDGETVAIERCNHSQRLVRLPETACRVRFEHHTPLLGIGLMLFAIAAIALLVCGRNSSDSKHNDETTG